MTLTPQTVTVYSPVLPHEGKRFESGPVAQQWLRDHGFHPRKSQPGEWVTYSLGRVVFASVVVDASREAWQPNYGRPFGEMTRGAA